MSHATTNQELRDLEVRLAWRSFDDEDAAERDGLHEGTELALRLSPKDDLSTATAYEERAMRRLERAGRVVPALVGTLAAVALCASSTSAHGHPAPGHAAAACPHTTLRLISYNEAGKRIRVPTRVTIQRRGITCAKARRMITAYLRRATPRVCTTHGTRCILSMESRWSCSFLSAGESETTGGAIMGCYRSPTMRFLIIPVGQTKTTGQGFYVMTAPGVSCGMSAHEVLCENLNLDNNERVTLTEDGTVQACRWTGGGIANPCNVGNAGEGTPTYQAGKRISVGPYKCDITATGVQCIVVASGKGFEMTATEAVTAVRGATIVEQQDDPQTTGR
jgi:hypothetical protein